MKKVGELLIDLAGIAGFASLGYGAWCIYEPAGFIVAGAMLLTGAILLSRK